MKFLDGLLLLLIGLRLAGLIDWSWWAVFAPLWVPLILAALLAGISATRKHVRQKRPQSQ